MSAILTVFNLRSVVHIRSALSLSPAPGRVTATINVNANHFVTTVFKSLCVGLHRLIRQQWRRMPSKWEKARSEQKTENLTLNALGRRRLMNVRVLCAAFEWVCSEHLKLNGFQGKERAHTIEPTERERVQRTATVPMPTNVSYNAPHIWLHHSNCMAVIKLIWVTLTQFALCPTQHQRQTPSILENLAQVYAFAGERMQRTHTHTLAWNLLCVLHNKPNTKRARTPPEVSEEGISLRLLTNLPTQNWICAKLYKRATRLVRNVIANIIHEHTNTAIPCALNKFTEIRVNLLCRIEIGRIVFMWLLFVERGFVD